MADDEVIEAIADAVSESNAEAEAMTQAEITARAISSDQTAVEIAQINADAAVEIASQEVEEEWLATQFAGVAAQHQLMLEAMARIEGSVQAIQILLTTSALIPTPPPEMTPEPPPPEQPTETPPAPSESTRDGKRRIRRLL